MGAALWAPFMFMCCCGRCSDLVASHRYVAYLSQANPGSPGQFSIVITDRFKRQIYLNLEFQPGTDEAIKAHLAKQMMLQKESNENLWAQLTSAQQDVQRLESCVTDLRAYAVACCALACLGCATLSVVGDAGLTRRVWCRHASRGGGS